VEEITAIFDFMDEIAALVPCYGSRGGNAVRVYTKDGTVHEITKTTRSVLKNVAAHYNVDLQAISNTYGLYLNRTLNIPIPLTAALTLAALKLRCPKYDSDGANGYINVHEVSQVIELTGTKKGEARCLVELKSGEKIPCYFSGTSTSKRIHEAWRVHKQFLDRHKLVGGSESVREVVENLGLGKWERLNKDILVLVTEDAPGKYS